MHAHLATFTGEEGVLFIGRAQEKTHLFRTERRRDAQGNSYPWIVKTTGVVDQFYVRGGAEEARRDAEKARVLAEHRATRAGQRGDKPNAR